MRAWKYLVLIGGIAGIAGFFLPLLAFRSEQVTLSVSAYQIVSGIDDVRRLVEEAKPMAAASADARQQLEAISAELERYRGVLVAVFAPAVALALLGALCGARHKMGRLAGLIAIALGLVNAGIWLVFFQVVMDEPDVRVNLGFGLHLVLIAGALGTLAGLGALVAPDRGGVES